MLSETAIHHSRNEFVKEVKMANVGPFLGTDLDIGGEAALH